MGFRSAAVSKRAEWTLDEVVEYANGMIAEVRWCRGQIAVLDLLITPSMKRCGGTYQVAQRYPLDEEPGWGFSFIDEGRDFDSYEAALEMARAVRLKLIQDQLDTLSAPRSVLDPQKIWAFPLIIGPGLIVQEIQERDEFDALRLFMSAEMDLSIPAIERGHEFQKHYHAKPVTHTTSALVREGEYVGTIHCGKRFGDRGWASLVVQNGRWGMPTLSPNLAGLLKGLKGLEQHLWEEAHDE